MTQSLLINKAIRTLQKADPVFAAAIKSCERPTFGIEVPKVSRYQSIVRAVIAQQVSTAAARTISGRLSEKCGGSITAEKVGQLSKSELQSVGLTGAKVRTLDELTQNTLSGDIRWRSFTHMSDRQIIDELTPLFGIGQWTVEMFLIFHLGRLDVWPVGDLAVRRGWDILHKNPEPIKPKALNLEGEQFAGYRSIVAWYCWRSS